MAINRIESGAIIIAGSGMANGGRILHHLKHNLGPPQRARRVRRLPGRRARSGGAWSTARNGCASTAATIRVNAQRHTVGGLSAHADQRGLMEWYGAVRQAIRRWRWCMARKWRAKRWPARSANATGIEVVLARPNTTLTV